MTHAQNTFSWNAHMPFTGDINRNSRGFGDPTSIPELATSQWVHRQNKPMWCESSGVPFHPKASSDPGYQFQRISPHLYIQICSANKCSYYVAFCCRVML